jgi:hypothetical protein
MSHLQIGLQNLYILVHFLESQIVGVPKGLPFKAVELCMRPHTRLLLNQLSVTEFFSVLLVACN